MRILRRSGTWLVFVGLLCSACLELDTAPEDAVVADGGIGADPGTASEDAGVANDAGTVDGGGNGSDGGAALDTSNAGLTAFVASEAYRGAGWVAEPGVHQDRGSGPHGMVRIYFNDVLAQSIKAGNSLHPRGSMVLKETYQSDGQTLKGHVLDVKDVDASGKDEWVWWYRPNSASGQAPTYFRGTGNFCASCHSQGVDFVIASPP